MKQRATGFGLDTSYLFLSDKDVQKGKEEYLLTDGRENLLCFIFGMYAIRGFCLNNFLPLCAKSPLHCLQTRRIILRNYQFVIFNPRLSSLVSLKGFGIL